MKSDNFTPVRNFHNVLYKWWLLVLAALVGGIAGYLASFALPPRYEAYAQISSQLDYTDASELEDYEENRAVNEVGWVCVLDPVLNKVEAQIRAQGFDIDRQTILDTFSVERIDDLWTLRVVHTDPKTAALFANIWADESYRQLTEAYGHALQAESLQTYITALESCLELPPAEAALLKICTFEDNRALSSEIRKKTEILQHELSQARLLHPDLQFSFISQALVPMQPTRRGKGSLVFAGAALAFILALAYLLIRGGEEKPHA